MDELVLSGKKYISSKRAAELTGYAKDYIGQLARSGKVEAKRVGRAWYVLEIGIIEHHAQGLEEVAQVEQAAKRQKPSLHPSFYSVYAFPRTWNQVKYIDDDADLFPVIRERTENEIDEIASKNIVSSAENIKILKPQLHNELPERPLKVAEKARKSINLDGVVFDIPKPEVSMPQKSPIRSVQRRPNFDLVPLSAFGLTALAVVLLVSGTFLPSVQFGGPENYSASPLQGLYDAWEAFKNSSFVQDGIVAIKGFFELLGSSFWAFFEAGIQFLRELF